MRGVVSSHWRTCEKLSAKLVRVLEANTERLLCKFPVFEELSVIQVDGKAKSSSTAKSRTEARIN